MACASRSGRLSRSANPIASVAQCSTGRRSKSRNWAVASASISSHRPLALFGIEVTKRGIELTHFHRPFAQRVERAGAARVELDAQPIDFGSRWLEVERLQRHAEQPDGLLVGQRVSGLLAGPRRVLDRFVDVCRQTLTG